MDPGKRSPRNELDPWRPYAFLVETEAGFKGQESVDVATIFLTNRECPWRCLMCDLWKNTLEETVPDGAIAAQIRFALEHLPTTFSPSRSHLKLYNAGSFFDPRAHSPAEYPEIARLSRPFQKPSWNVTPRWSGHAAWSFRSMLSKPLEVAMGLETIHPEVLKRLNKAHELGTVPPCRGCLGSESDRPPSVHPGSPALALGGRGVGMGQTFARFRGRLRRVRLLLIPTRAGNGGLDSLMASGEFAPPSLASLEAALEYGLSRHTGRVFADLWDVETFIRCRECSPARIERIRTMNATQQIAPPIECGQCRIPFGIARQNG